MRSQFVEFTHQVGQHFPRLQQLLDAPVRMRDVASAVRAYLLMVKQPNVTNTLELEQTMVKLATPADIEAAIGALRNHPRGRAMLDSRVLPKLPSPAELASIPSGTLGHGYHSYMTQYQLSPDYYPSIDLTNDLQYFRLRMYQVHDFIHVLTGYQADYVGEIGIVGFTMAQLDRHFGHPGRILAFSTMLTTGMFLHGAVFAAETLPTFLTTFAEGWQRGQAAKSLFDVPWEEKLDQPLDALRASYEIRPQTYLQ